ncbi:MAG: cation transporting ATPase C-terminal domain-containing protein, partial [Elainella sp.]
GIILAVVTIAMMVWAYGYTERVQGNGLDRERWQTMVFTTLCLAQMGHAFAVRSSNRLMAEVNPFANPYVLAAVSVTSVLQILLIYVEPLRNFFNTHYLSGLELLICVGFSSLIFVWIELEKLFIRWFMTEKKSA